MKDSSVSAAFGSFAGDDRAVSMVEYAILLACIAVLCMGALAGMGQNVSTTYFHAIVPITQPPNAH